MTPMLGIVPDGGEVWGEIEAGFMEKVGLVKKIEWG